MNDLKDIQQKNLEKAMAELEEYEISEKLQQVVDKALKIEPKIVDKIAEHIQKDVLYLTRYADEEKSERAHLMEYSFFFDGGEIPEGLDCTLGYNSKQVPQMDYKSFSPALFKAVFPGAELMVNDDYDEDSDDFDVLADLTPVGCAQLAIYIRKACGQLQEQGFFQHPQLVDTLATSFKIAVDTEGGVIHHTAFQLNSQKNEGNR